MTDKLANFDAVPILVGQRWLTRHGQTVRILATDGIGNFPVIGEADSGGLCRWKLTGRASSEHTDLADLVSLAPQTVKREVALYRGGNGLVWAGDWAHGHVDAECISDPLSIEFTLKSGESA
jgi:hypothetical protein